MIKIINIIKKTNVWQLVLMLPLALSAQQVTSTYVTPSYTKVYEAEVDRLPDVWNGDKKFVFSNISNDFDATHDGFMVLYEPYKKTSEGANELLMSLYNGSNKLLEIFHENNQTLKLRRYHNINTSTYVDYVLLDKLVTIKDKWPIYKIYFSSHFIWIEDSIFGEPTSHNRGHSPLFWGLDISGDANLQLFTKKSPNAEIHLSQYHRGVYSGKDLQIFGFNTATLLAELNQNFASAPLATNNARKKENKITDFIDKDALLLQQQALIEDKETLSKAITISPNPTSSLLNIVFEKRKLGTSDNLIFNLSDVSGRVILSDEIQIKSGVYQKQITLPNSLPKGIYFFNFSLGIEKGSKKLLVN